MIINFVNNIANCWRGKQCEKNIEEPQRIRKVSKKSRKKTLRNCCICLQEAIMVWEDKRALNRFTKITW